MRAATTDVINLLATRSFVKCELYTFNDLAGNAHRYADGDVNVSFGGNTWFCSGPLFSRDKGTWRLGLDASSWNVTVQPRPFDTAGNADPDTIMGQPWIKAARAGVFDGCDVLVERAYLPAWPQPWVPTVTPTGTVIVIGGRVGEIYPSRSGVVVQVVSHFELLNTKMPRNLFQSGCRHTLFDAGCTLNAASFTTTATIGAGSTQNAILVTTLGAFAAGYFDLGRVLMTGGANAGFARGIRSWDGTTLSLLSPFPFPFIAGDAFNVRPGCDKTKATCTAKFANIVNYGGQPDIPAPETAI